jgi:hypothetical protein
VIGPAPRATAPVDPGDERRHAAPPGARSWCETFTWELDAGPTDPAVTIRLVLHGDRAWYLAAVVRPDGPLTVVTDLDVPRPSSPASLEIRTSGLWADHNVETPLAHVSVGLEAFGVALDDPADALTDGFGVRTPVGFDLEWEDDRPPVAGLRGANAVAGLAGDRYEAPGRAHGEILLGSEAFLVDGAGSREHAWGTVDWCVPGWWRASIRWDDGSHTVARGSAADLTGRSAPGRAEAPGAAVTVAPGLRGPNAEAGVRGPNAEAGVRGPNAGLGSGPPAGDGPAAVTVAWDDWGLPVGGHLVVGALRYELDPRACVPVPLDGAGRGSTLRSALVTCRRPSDGRPVGSGWIELVGPLPAST